MIGITRMPMPSPATSMFCVVVGLSNGLTTSGAMNRRAK